MTAGITLEDHESLLGSSWVTSLSSSSGSVSFAATRFPAALVSDVVTLYLTTDGAGESLISALTILEEDEYDQDLNLALGSANADTDGDGLTDTEEEELGTDPNSADSDGDGLSDAIEVSLGTNPLSVDSDSDGYTDYEETEEGTSPVDADDAPSAGLSIMIFKAAIDAANNAEKALTKDSP
jgi:hypothetical protein